jgi:hypothetical protein
VRSCNARSVRLQVNVVTRDLERALENMWQFVILLPLTKEGPGRGLLADQPAARSVHPK